MDRFDVIDNSIDNVLTEVEKAPKPKQDAPKPAEAQPKNPKPTIKDKFSNAWKTAKEKGGEFYDAAKEKGGEALDKTKEVAGRPVTIGGAAVAAGGIGAAIGAWKLYKLWKAKRAAAKTPEARAKAEKMMKKAKAKATREAFGLDIAHYSVFMEMSDSIPDFLEFYTEALLTEDERYHIEQRVASEILEEDEAAITSLEAQIVAINNIYE